MTDMTFITLLVGLIIVVVILVRSGLTRLSLPAMVGYIGVGFLVRLADLEAGFLSERAMDVFEFLATLGVITLLFRIGLESKLARLLGQLRRASLIWIPDITVSGTAGFAAAVLLLDLDLIPGLFIAVALTATSVGIAVSVWHEAGALGSRRGNLLVDIAELDDVSGIVLMALLFALVPALSGSGALLPAAAAAGGVLVLKLAAFGAVCVLFALYAERRVTGFFERIAAPPAPMLVVAGIGIVMAALAGLLGFSVAIGAFFAGLVFSRDPQSVQIDASFGSVYQLFSPFFFIGIGLSVDPAILPAALGPGAVLVAAAVLGKLFGDGVPSMAAGGGWQSFGLIGTSMVPRAEISLIIMQRGHGMGIVPDRIFAGMVLVSLVTCLASPLVVGSLLRKWPQNGGAQ